MKDLLVIAMTLAFFAVTMAVILLCDRIIGPDDEPESSFDEAAAVEAVG